MKAMFSLLLLSVALGAQTPQTPQPCDGLACWTSHNPNELAKSCAELPEAAKVTCLMNVVAPAEKWPTIVSTQLVLTQRQKEAFPQNAHIKLCGPDNHEGACYDPKLPNITNHLYGKSRESCEQGEGVACEPITGSYWVPIGKPVFECEGEPCPAPQIDPRHTSDECKNGMWPDGSCIVPGGINISGDNFRTTTDGVPLPITKIEPVTQPVLYCPEGWHVEVWHKAYCHNCGTFSINQGEGSSPLFTRGDSPAHYGPYSPPILITSDDNDTDKHHPAKCVVNHGGKH